MSQSDRTIVVHSGGMRLDQFLGDNAGLKSRSEARQLIDNGRVKLNGKRCDKASTIVKAGDHIQASLPFPPPMPDAPSPSIALSVLYEDSHCLVVDKPSGIAVHPGSGMLPTDETILSALRPLFSERLLPFHASSVLVHRLDKDTTGCLLIAKTPEAHTQLQKQFADRTIEKTYLALVEGVPSPSAAVIDAPVGRHRHDRTKMSVLHASSKVRGARTTYRTMERGAGCALLSCELHTGRTHQLRVHLSTIGHPILGDPTYTSKEATAIAKHHGITSICLHAWKLSFTSLAHKRLTVSSAPPSTFRLATASLGLHFPITDH